MYMFMREYKEYLILRDEHIVTSNRKLIIFRHHLGSFALYAAPRTVCGLHYGEPHLGKVEEYAVLLDFCCCSLKLAFQNAPWKIQWFGR